MFSIPFQVAPKGDNSLAPLPRTDSALDCLLYQSFYLLPHPVFQDRAVFYFTSFVSHISQISIALILSLVYQ